MPVCHGERERERREGRHKEQKGECLRFNEQSKLEHSVCPERIRTVDRFASVKTSHIKREDSVVCTYIRHSITILDPHPNSILSHLLSRISLQVPHQKASAIAGSLAGPCARAMRKGKEREKQTGPYAGRLRGSQPNTPNTPSVLVLFKPLQVQVQVQGDPGTNHTQRLSRTFALQTV